MYKLNFCLQKIYKIVYKIIQSRFVGAIPKLIESKTDAKNQA
jgi:hypothetical protein